MSVTRRRRRSPIGPLLVGVLVIAAILVLAAQVLTGSSPHASPSPSPVAAVTPTPTITITPTGTPEASAVPSDTPEPTASETASATPATVPSAPPAVVSTSTTARDPAGAWLVTFAYPQFAKGSTPFAEAMNADLKQAVQLQVVQWEAGPAASLAPGSAHANSLTGSFTVAYLSPSVASFRIKSVEDLNASHPSTTLQTVTYNLATGQRLGLGDLFPDMQAGLNALSAQSKTLLKSVLGADYDQNVVEFGTQSDPNNFAAWAPTRQGVEITFREYQVGSYADGLPRIVVPWSALTQVLAPSGPMAALYSR